MRRDDWEPRLKAVIDAHADAEGAWGKSACWTLATGAYEAVTGKKLLPKLRRYTSAKTAMKLGRKHGFTTVEDALASALKPKSCFAAMRGDLGVIERDGIIACCVITGVGAVVKNEGDGITVYPLSSVKTVFEVA